MASVKRRIAVPNLCRRRRRRKRLWPRIARKTDGEYAAGARHIPDAQRPRVRFNAAAGDEEAQTKTRPILAVLSEGSKHLFGASWRQSATVVRDLDKYSPAKRIGSQLDLGVLVCELEGILEKVGQGG